MSKHIQNLYGLLGVEETASPAEIKKAYHKLSQKYHPDVTTEENAEEMMQTVTRAYEVITTPAKQKEFIEEQKTKTKESLRKQQREKATKDKRAKAKKAKKDARKRKKK